ncbi:MAG: hypothetical protein JWO88_3251 [Frankiales bacterium]|nr:hypothetical protein [Frankiales bacterium]
MGWAETARRLDDRVLGEAASPRARRRNRVLLVVALVWIPSVTAAKAWSVPVGLVVAVFLVAPVVALVRRVSGSRTGVDGPCPALGAPIDGSYAPLGRSCVP